MIDKVKFEGIFVEEQTHFMCRAEGGVFRAPLTDVELLNGSAYIRVGALVELVRSPIGEADAGREQPVRSGEATACIGQVEISCETGTVVGACSGSWACP
jgi:hypothetical protein